MKEKIKNIIFYLFLLICSIMIVTSAYYTINYPTQEFDEILFYALNGVEHTSPDVIKSIVKACIIPIILLTVLLILPTLRTRKNKFTLIKKHKLIYIIAIFILSFVYTIFAFKIPSYIESKSKETKIYDEYYIEGKDVNITFPSKKKNLILIIMESMENSVLSKENGGAWDYSLTPELEALALDNINFSNTEKLGGVFDTYGASFTAGGMVALTSGTPLVTPSLSAGNINSYNGTGRYLSGAYTLGEVLRDDGYNLEIMMGSDGEFGGRTQYFTANGNYKVFDFNYAVENGYMTEEEEVWWGFEDDKLFDWSKQEILNLASKNNPFNYIMLTADTHFTDGYLSEKAEIKYDSQYENVYSYSSKCIYEFIEWLKSQDFYEDTTIVVVGDHIGMQNAFYTSKTDEDYKRTVFNIFINSEIPDINSKNRTCTTFDIYPTILASMGIKIDGNKLGLGTNLFSGEPTLAEKIGYDYLNKELRKNSEFYNNHVLGEDYYVIKEYEAENIEADD